MNGFHRSRGEAPVKPAAPCDRATRNFAHDSEGVDEIVARFGLTILPEDREALELIEEGFQRMAFRPVRFLAEQIPAP